MRRKTSICILAVVLVVAAVLCMFGFGIRREELPVPDSELPIIVEQETEQAVESNKTEENYQFIIFEEEDGRLSVYYSDNVSRYFDTGISADTLPEELKEELSRGIRFLTEEELFDFLESYSS